MEKVIFPQADKAPVIIKEKVMWYVMADINKKSSLIKRFSLTKILLPNLVILVLIVWVFSFVSQRKLNWLIQTITPTIAINSTDQTTTTDSVGLQDSQWTFQWTIQWTLDDKLAEADILLQELENLDNLI